jgi:hypothetical protein
VTRAWRQWSAAAAIVLAGCSTPQEVRDLSTETSRAATDLSVALRQTAAASQSMDAARLRALGWQEDDTMTARASLDARIAAAKQVKDPLATQYQAIMDFVVTQQTAIDKVEAASLQHQAELQKAMLAPTLGLTELREVSANLNDLGDKESFKTRLKLTVEFVADVASRAKAEAKKAAAKKEETEKAANPEKLPTVPAPSTAP